VKPKVFKPESMSSSLDALWTFIQMCHVCQLLKQPQPWQSGGRVCFMEHI